MTRITSTPLLEDLHGDEPPQLVGTARLTSDAVKDYLNRIGKVPLLTAEQEVDLAQRIQAGLAAKEKLTADRAPLDLVSERELERTVRAGEIARDRMVEANLRLVVSLAKRQAGRGMLLMDLIQEGNLGLLRAVEKFDHTKGFKFSTYATWWIRQGVTRGMADQSRTVRVPVHMVETMNLVARTQRQMLQDIGREPTQAEVAEEMDLTEEQLGTIQQYGRAPVSLHTPVGYEGGSEFGDLIADPDARDPEDAASKTQLKEQLRAVLGTLSDREAGVLLMRHGLTGEREKTLVEIGAAYGLTRERIRQIEVKAMSKLRHLSVAQSLRDYLS